MPLSHAYRTHAGDDRAARLTAASARTTTNSLFAMPANAVPPVDATHIGRFARGEGLHLFDGGEPIPPSRSPGFPPLTPPKNTVIPAQAGIHNL